MQVQLHNFMLYADTYILTGEKMKEFSSTMLHSKKCMYVNILSSTMVINFMTNVIFRAESPI